MDTDDLRALIGKLNPICHQALMGSLESANARTHPFVETEHLLLKLLEDQQCDVTTIFRHYGVDTMRSTQQLEEALNRLKTGSGGPPAFSGDLVDLLRQAWVMATTSFGAQSVRSGHILSALLADDSLLNFGRRAAREFAKIPVSDLKQGLVDITANSNESDNATEAGPAEGQPTGGPGKTKALEQFTVDLTAAAKAGRIDPVLGRDSEIRQIVDILTRRRQNNPILTGEAGVGKTAVVEGFALRIAQGDVPPALRDVAIRTLDLALLQAGAGVRGEFENRLKSVINEVKSSPQPIILFIDEAHTMIGAGGQAGQGDAANLLKPALARGELRTIAATTWAEYKKYFERDAALARRFQVVAVDEPDEEGATEMMRGVAATLENHHNVRILDEALTEAVRLSHRYITGRQLPDKSVSLLDTAAARVAGSQSNIPPLIEDTRRRVEQIGVTTEILEREAQSGADHADRLNALHAERDEKQSVLDALEQRWAREKELVGDARLIRDRLEGVGVAPDEGESPESAEEDAPGELTEAESDSLRGELADKLAELEALQGEEPLMHVCVDAQAVAQVVSEWTGIPVGRMVTDEINSVLALKDAMAQSVVGQDHALEAIAQRIRTSRAGLADPGQPIGVFMLAGPSGVGKTETAITLANLLYGGEQNMTVINMSEFKEEHKVSLLMGSPPGYVGYGEGGVLTEAVRRKPYSVLLLDEMEKAHPGVQDVFYQVFDKGMMKDGEGRDIDFKNTVILMTSNAGTDLIMSLCADPETAPEPEGLTDALHEDLLNSFKPAFLGRVALVPYYPLSDDVMVKIINLKLGKVGRRVTENYGATFTYSDEV
ncbi:MAG: type VI secretion system ATPase TssH, partial [Gammaproteobacteria bacterium]|nr:type VI secretion system ATPase TssH [Gammaproteobacteria bacterium]